MTKAIENTIWDSAGTAVITIPKKIMEYEGLVIGDKVRITIEKVGK